MEHRQDRRVPLIIAGLLLLACAQTSVPRGPQVDDDLVHWIVARPHSQSIADFEATVDDARRANFETMLLASIAGDSTAAMDAALQAGYRMSRFTLPIEATAFYEPGSVGLQPTVVIATQPALDLIVEAPHASFEQETVPEATEAFVRGRGRALIVSGAHRCASPMPSRCQDGQGTSVCGTTASGGPLPYPSSDVAHNPDSLFALATRVLSARWPRAVVVQLHGMKPDPTHSYAWTVISDGTRLKRAPDTQAPGRIRDRLRSALGRQGAAVSCQDAADDSVPHRSLCARDNVEGRLLNGSSEACVEPSTAAPGRFLHLEQLPDVFASALPRDAVIAAVLAESPLIP